MVDFTRGGPEYEAKVVLRFERGVLMAWEDNRPHSGPSDVKDSSTMDMLIAGMFWEAAVSPNP